VAARHLQPGDVIMTRWTLPTTAALALTLAACGDAPTALRPPPVARADESTPLIMHVGGPPSGTPGHTCTWGAYASGGTRPYTYYFEVNGFSVQHVPESPSDIRYTVQRGVQTIHMEVTDATGTTVTDDLDVLGTNVNPQC
jgi:hypothetical protein